jgi:hypothetical protein
MAAHKEYSGTLRLGEGTPSLDAETPVEERLPWEHITDEQLQEAARKLTGDIQQVPPMYSALHHNVSGPNPSTVYVLVLWPSAALTVPRSLHALRRANT